MSSDRDALRQLGSHLPVDMRDVRALHDRADVIEAEARAWAGALHARLDAEKAARAEFEREARAYMRWSEDTQRVMLTHLERLVEVPGRETFARLSWQEHASVWLARPASTRAVLALAAAGVLATLSGCVAILGVHP